MRIRCTATDLFGLATNTCFGQRILPLGSWIADRRMIDGGSASLTYLKNVEPFILHHLAVIAQQLHT
jgi:hypothetical protein